MPSPPSGGSSGGQSGGGSESGGQESGSEGSGPTSDGGGSGGDVGTIPPPPSQRGSGGADGADSGESGDGGDGDDNPFSDADASGEGECGDTGVIPGGIGGMGQAGECIGGGGGAASEAESSSSASGGGGGADGSSEAEEGGAAGSVGQFPEESPAERSARLGRELDESLGDFDETLQGEQQDIAAVGRVLEGYDTEGGGGDGKGGVVSLGSQAGGRGGGPNEGGSVGGNKGPIPKIDGMTQEQIEERTPDDVPALVDDDIIARQLREAALTEEDPVLRERLWDEYRKYRGILTSN